ncbi:hypothetical protein An12g09160 [Aspergillus niger]|uniref:Uncharacterized protein n=2 Tax=Aspergillus niger TaxID=5061 RepID=A2R0M9_ASPNC|nr:hypothetical protein An12g09160 [Aspergillus niger]CAK46403.1 hypothetical protein An12g09160 [Aspergillus niger]
MEFVVPPPARHVLPNSKNIWVCFGREPEARKETLGLQQRSRDRSIDAGMGGMGWFVRIGMVCVAKLPSSYGGRHYIHIFMVADSWIKNKSGDMCLPTSCFQQGINRELTGDVDMWLLYKEYPSSEQGSELPK